MPKTKKTKKKNHKRGGASKSKSQAKVSAVKDESESSPIERAFTDPKMPSLEEVLGECRAKSTSREFMTNPLSDLPKASRFLAVFYVSNPAEKERAVAVAYLRNTLLDILRTSTDSQEGFRCFTLFWVYAIKLLKQWCPGTPAYFITDSWLSLLDHLSSEDPDLFPVALRSSFPLDLPLWHALFKQCQGFFFQFLERLFFLARGKIAQNGVVANPPPYLVRVMTSLLESFPKEAKPYQEML